MGWRSGTFGVPAEQQPPDFLAYHHSEDDIEEIAAQYEVQWLNRNSSLSMNGNDAKMFEMLAKNIDLRLAFE